LNRGSGIIPPTQKKMNENTALILPEGLLKHK
jgi:hypothetical protein